MLLETPCNCGRYRCRRSGPSVTESDDGARSHIDVDDPASLEADALPPEAFCIGYTEIAGLEIDCVACQVSGPWSAADGSVVYCAPEPRHHHQRSTDVRSRDLKAGDQAPRDDDPTAVVTRELMAAEVWRQITHRFPSACG